MENKKQTHKAGSAAEKTNHAGSVSHAKTQGESKSHAAHTANAGSAHGAAHGHRKSSNASEVGGSSKMRSEHPQSTSPSSTSSKK